VRGGGGVLAGWSCPWFSGMAPPGRPAVAGGWAGLAARIHAEERQLTESLSAEYEHFAAGRKRLVPGMW
jgi:protein-S-isoprenylcysteine O-methyltransferase Ste14